jgi:outer membrane protein TolC
MRLILITASLFIFATLPLTSSSAQTPGDGTVSEPGAAPASTAADTPASAAIDTPATAAIDTLVGARPEAGNPTPLSLQQAEELALSRNEQVLIAREEIERTKGLVREIRAQSLPSLDVDYTYTRNLQQPVIFFNQNGEIQQIRIGSNNDNNLHLGVEQKLFSRAVTAASRAAVIAQDVSRFGLEATGEDLTLQVRRAYYAALVNDALVKVQEEALQQAQRRLRQVEQFLQVGTAAEFDRLTAQVEVDNIQPLLIQASNDYELSLNGLKRLVGIPLDQPIGLTDSLTYEPVGLSLAQAQDRALAQRDDLRRQNATVLLQQQAVVVERAASFPELTLNLDLTRRASSDDFVPPTSDFSQTTTAAVELSIPVFDGRAAEGRVRQARAELSKQELALTALKQDVALQVQQAYQNVTAGAQRIEAAGATVGRAQRALEIAQTRFKNGLSTQVELNDAELALTQAQTTVARALYDYNVAQAELVRAMGER